LRLLSKFVPGCIKGYNALITNLLVLIPLKMALENFFVTVSKRNLQILTKVRELLTFQVDTIAYLYNSERGLFYTIEQ